MPKLLMLCKSCVVVKPIAAFKPVIPNQHCVECRKRRSSPRMNVIPCSYYEYINDEAIERTTIQFNWVNHKLTDTFIRKMEPVWIDETKKIAQWKKGKTLYMFAWKQNDNEFIINYTYDSEFLDYPDVIVNADGTVRGTNLASFF